MAFFHSHSCFEYRLSRSSEIGNVIHCDICEEGQFFRDWPFQRYSDSMLGLLIIVAKVVRINEIHLPASLKHLISEQFANSLSLIVTFLIKFVIHLSCIIIKNENMKFT